MLPANPGWLKSARHGAVLGAGLAGCICLSYAVASVWRRPCASLLYFVLIPLVLLAASRIIRSGASEIAAFVGLVAAAALFRMSHENVTGAWYVDYLGPMNSAVIPEIHVRGGLSGLLRCLSFLVPVPPAAVFACSRICSSLGVGFLVSALWRHQQRGLPQWPPFTLLIWGVLLATDGTLTYLGASDAHHNIALLAFSLSLWWYGEALRQNPVGGEASTSWWPLLGAFLCSSLVGLTRVELLASPLAIPFLLPARNSSWRDWRQVKAWTSVGLGMLLAWIVVSDRNPLAQIAMFHPHSTAQCVYGLFRQSLFCADLPPLLVRPCLGAAFLVFLFCAVRFGSRRHLGLAFAFTILTLPKVLGGFGTAPLGGFEDTQRYNIILIPLALLIGAAGIAYAVMLLRTRQLPFRGARGWGAAGALVCSGAGLCGAPRFSFCYALGGAIALALIILGIAQAYPWVLWRQFLSEGAKRRCAIAGLACIGLGIAASTLEWVPRDVLLLPHQAEFTFLSRNLVRVPLGSTIVSVWLKRLQDRDADTQLAVPHSLLVHERPDINWVVVMPGDPIPAVRPLLYYKGASCSMDPAQGVTNGPDRSSDRELLKSVAALCRSLEKMTSPWEVRQRVRIKEGTVHIVNEELDLGLGWIRRRNLGGT
ncbi:MAG: hypothetical protein ACHQ49_01950 [Elusimicrobiota bacterium]